jgi:hypothetical protein
MGKSKTSSKKNRAEKKAAISAVAEIADLVWQDSEWEPALNALQGWESGLKYTAKSNPTPLAKLLISGKPVPAAVAMELGCWLDPPWGKKGPRLAAVLPKRYYPGTSTIKTLIEIKGMVKKALLTLNNNVEAAVHQVMLETGLSRSQVMKAHTLSKRQIVLETSRFNPHSYLSPRESGES